MKYLILIATLVLLPICNSSRHRSDISEAGIASWSSPDVEGKITSSGEHGRKGDMTAAHRTLPIGSRVLVRSISTGREVSVRINDRGPFRNGHIINLSYAAAQKLGITQIGPDKVELFIEEVAVQIFPTPLPDSLYKIRK
jgi:rare lipoprotein A